MEIAQMIAHIAVTVAAGIATYTLWIHRTNVILQKQNLCLQSQNLQANLFKDISDRINELRDQWSACKTKEDKEEYYEKLFTAFEYFAFFANRGYLSVEMKYYYKSGIEECCQRPKNYPSLLRHYQKLPTGQMDEFKKFYKDVTGKRPPF